MAIILAAHSSRCCHISCFVRETACLKNISRSTSFNYIPLNIVQSNINKLFSSFSVQHQKNNTTMSSASASSSPQSQIEMSDFDRKSNGNMMNGQHEKHHVLSANNNSLLTSNNHLQLCKSASFSTLSSSLPSSSPISDSTSSPSPMANVISRSPTRLRSLTNSLLNYGNKNAIGKRQLSNSLSIETPPNANNKHNRQVEGDKEEETSLLPPVTSLLDDNYHFTYDDAVAGLNSLQTNAQYVEARVKEQSREHSSNVSQSLSKTFAFLSLLDIKPEMLNRLNAIHVSGTKGKGSTCAFVESILRQHGYKTGFYSSPHLVAVRERIRINGQPISKEEFTRYFWLVFKTLEKNKPSDMGMPPYFMFLTLMALKYFVDEKIDVAILEVGIGGEYDCTNVIAKPIVCGVTSLGYDHCSLLGYTIDKIAWQKAGIFKPNVRAFTVKQENSSAMEVLQERAKEKKCSLSLCPPLSHYPNRVNIKLGIAGEVQKVNASIALQLSHLWLQKRINPNYEPSTLITKEGIYADPFPLSERYLAGLELTSWPGRCQIIRRDNIVYFLDGAHTAESMTHCAQWFHKESDRIIEAQSKNGHNYANVTRVLVFNCTGGRQPDPLLAPLCEKIKFNMSIFCPNRVQNVKDVASDQSNFTVTPQKEMEQCNLNAISWQRCNDYKENVMSKFSCISDAISFISAKAETEFPSSGLSATKGTARVHVLVTGSIHLVGNVLGIVDPDLS